MRPPKLLIITAILSIIASQMTTVFADDFTPADTTTGAVTATSGLTSTGAAVNLNVNSNFTTGINTGTSTGAVTIGGNANNIAIDSSIWDISSAGIASGFTGITSTGTINFSGAGSYRMREVANQATAACTTVNELVLNTTNNQIYKCTVIGAPGTWVSTGGAGSTPDFEAVYTQDADKILTTSNGIFTIAAGSGAVNINSTTGGVSLNNNINGAVNIATGSSTGAVTIGGNSNTIAINSSVWDITAAGVASGLTGLASTGNITFTGANITGASPLIFDGLTANANKTTLAITDPTGARTITVPDISGTLVTTGDTDTVTSTMVLNDTLTTSDLSATLTFADSDFLDLSGINQSGTAEGFRLPQATDISAGTAEGQIGWDTDGDLLQIGTNGGIKTIGAYNNIQSFSTSGTWTKPAGVSQVYVQVWGGGGGGRNGANTQSGGGGGGGGYSAGIVNVTGNVTVTVGNGGTAGNAGGLSSFAGATTITGNGGGAGTAAGGTGGAGTGGTVNLSGATGTNGENSDGASGGSGGGSPFGGAGGGGGAGANAANPSGPGGAGTNPGGGGGGGAENAGTGGTGGAGLVIVYY